MAYGSTHPGTRRSFLGWSRPGHIGTANLIFLGVIALSIVVITVMQTRTNQAAEAVATGLFDEAGTFSAAVERAKATDKPVFVLATADWCGPCQTMKRTTLADAEVQDRLRATSVPYLLDVTSSSSMSAEDGELAKSLGVSSIPAAYMVEPDGMVRAAFRGVRAKDSFLEWLDANG